MTNLESIKEIMCYLPVRVQNFLKTLSEQKLSQIQEIRLRNGKPLGIVSNAQENSEKNIIISFEEISKTFQAVCSYSVYRYEQELSEGYITVKGGCRVGICGSAVRNGQNIQSLKAISSLNFRIAGERIGIAEPLRNYLSGSLLIAGTVGSGKTTYLRDLCRLTGNQSRTALIDERGELAAVYRGIPAHDVGLMTDILDGYPRAAGILTALRVMTPEYIICDEISTESDREAVQQAAGCGIKLIAACHAGSPEELRQRSLLRPLLEAEVFQTQVFLKDREIQKISYLKK
ncbi:MAG: stage III sporulation protein AA [Oscillospiraceae bacterium]|nr:stage III sporulation protein AA [Oscillospiraceae bacterium]